MAVATEAVPKVGSQEVDKENAPSRENEGTYETGQYSRHEDV